MYMSSTQNEHPEKALTLSFLTRNNTIVLLEHYLKYTLYRKCYFLSKYRYLPWRFVQFWAENCLKKSNMNIVVQVDLGITAVFGRTGIDQGGRAKLFASNDLVDMTTDRQSRPGFINKRPYCPIPDMTTR